VPARPDIAVLTPTLPRRTEMLAEAIASVEAQTLKPAAHLIGVDHAGVGIGLMLNRLAAATRCQWLARLDDDDLLEPRHLEVLASAVPDADVVYTWCRIAPRVGPDGEPPTPSVLGTWWTPNQEFDPDALRVANYIPATALIRRSLWEDIGGWSATGPPPQGAGEDWDFWLRALDHGARFRCIPEVTWIYRYHGANVWFR
jgi:GT2 family glycosyltransferase